MNRSLAYLHVDGDSTSPATLRKLTKRAIALNKELGNPHKAAKS